MQVKFEPVFVTVAVAEDEDPLRDFTKNVHVKEKDILFQMCSFFALNLINQPKSVSNE